MHGLGSAGGGAPLYPTISEIWREFGAQSFAIKELAARTTIGRAAAYRDVPNLALCEVLERRQVPKEDREKGEHGYQYQLHTWLANRLAALASKIEDGPVQT
jgi:hypothetical protein